jgi:hypothetical protein
MFNRKVSAAITVLLVALVTIALVASALPVFAGQASALPMHAQLVSTSPKDGASLPTAEEVALTFSEDVNEQFLRVTVTGPDGAEVDGKPAVDGPRVTQPLAADLPAGEHEVVFRVVSVDGHPVSGKISFTTTQAPASATPSPSATPTPSASETPSATLSATPVPSVTAAPVSTEEDSTPWLAIIVGLALGVLLGGVLVRLVLARAARGKDASAGP